MRDTGFSHLRRILRRRKEFAGNFRADQEAIPQNSIRFTARGRFARVTKAARLPHACLIIIELLHCSRHLSREGDPSSKRPHRTHSYRITGALNTASVTRRKLMSHEISPVT